MLTNKQEHYEIHIDRDVKVAELMDALHRFYPDEMNHYLYNPMNQTILDTTIEIKDAIKEGGIVYWV